MKLGYIGFIILSVAKSFCLIKIDKDCSLRSAHQPTEERRANMSIWVITHGEKKDGPNPTMTEKGWKEVASLQAYLPSEIPLVIRGEATRHRDTRDAVGLKNHPNQQVLSLWGGAASLEKRSSGSVLVLADGEEVPFCSMAQALYPSIKEAVRILPDGTVVCAGKEAMSGAFRQSGLAQGGALYRLHIDSDQLVVTLVAKGSVK